MFIYNLQAIAQNLEMEYRNISSKIEHNGLKGTLREDKLKQYLKKLFPQKYEFASGLIVDANEKQSRQQDFIIYDHFNSPSFIETDSVQVVPIESVYATIEVKSTLTIDELNKSVENIKSVKELQKTEPFIKQIIVSNIPTPISAIFAYSSDTSLENIVSKLEELNKSIYYQQQLNIVCILDKGLIWSVNKNGFDKIEITPNEESILVTHQDKIENNLYLFYLMIMTWINNIILPPVNLMGYAKKIKKANYSGTVSRNRIPDDLYYDAGNGQLSNAKIASDTVLKVVPALKKFSEKAFSKTEVIDYIVNILYELSKDPYMTGKKDEINSNGITFLDIKLSKEQLEKLKKYNKNSLGLEEKEEIEILINKLYEKYKSD